MILFGALDTRNELTRVLFKMYYAATKEYWYEVCVRRIDQYKGISFFDSLGLLTLAAFEQTLNLVEEDMRGFDEKIMERQRRENPQIVAAGYTLKNFQYFAWKYNLLPAWWARSTFKAAHRLRKARGKDEGEPSVLFADP